MDSRSLWVATTPAPERSSHLPPSAEVVVIGAGIAGLTTAFLLAEAGRAVTVVEAGQVAAGVSGYTTAKVTAQHGLKYDGLGTVAAASYGTSQLAALDWIVRVAREHDIECALERVDSYVYTTDQAQRDTLRAEAEAASVAGLPASYVDSLDVPVGAVGAVRFAGQAQFHPRQWLLGLASLVEGHGGKIVEGVRALGVSEARPLLVRTTAGTIQAGSVVVATHFPILDRGLFFARLDPVRDLVVAGPAPAEVHGTYLDAQTHHSVRTATAGGSRYLVVGGEHYRVGDRVDVASKYERLADWAGEHLGLKEITHRWSAHDMSTLDGLPYIGRYHPRAKNLFVATGFGQWGMTGGTVAGLLLRDLVLGRENELATLYDPNRVSLSSVPPFMSNNATVARHLVADHVRALRPADPESLKPGTACVTRRGAGLVAAYRDDDGDLHEVSARCTHLGCLVAFNNAERSWDCPCHGSRFGVDGSVLRGPAVRPLRKLS
jgi:glycine/D-amino acid oxidase-like deaminating enzyme/nitrite reductase/ring-hydroxylating ferredoxin subunit